MAAAGNLLVFEAADEKTVMVDGGKKEVRCVEYPVAAGAGPAMVLLFTVTEGEQGKEVAEVVEEELVLAGGGCYYDERTGTWEHFVDVQTNYDAFMVLVSVNEDDDRIVRICQFN